MLTSPDQKSKCAIEIVSMGCVDSNFLSIISGHLQALMGLNTHIAPLEDEPDYAFISARGQYDAAKILGKLSTQDTGALQLGIIDSDLCTPILTYVFGESQLGGKAAVISLYRLHDVSLEITYVRAAKISLHEVGHLLGINHCWQPFCLMHFAATLENLDTLSMEFCSACEFEIRRRLQIQP